MLQYEQARQRAEEFVRDHIQPGVTEELAISEVREYPTCWIVTYNSRLFIDTGRIRDALAGNSPLIINKRAGVVRVGLTSKRVEDQLDTE